MTPPPYITSQQSKWFKSVQEGLEQDTGRNLDDWILIAKACPEIKHKARLNWFKVQHGLGVNRASLVLNAAFKTGLGWDNPKALLEQLWKVSEDRFCYDHIETIAKSLGDDVIITPRKSFSAFSRRVQFAALRPTRSEIRLGLAVPLKEATGCVAPLSSDSWSDRLTAVRLIRDADDIDEDVRTLMRHAYSLSG